ncbi:MAG: histidine ammonia-lyase [Candidatus Bathyarchaeia archaeon]
MKKVYVNGETLTIEDVVVVARHNAKAEIPKKVRDKVKKCRRFLEQLVREKRVVYGVTTGFGALGNITIPPRDLRELQSNLIRSHSAGVGKPLDKDLVRAMMLLRVNTLAKGYSGIRLETLETLVRMLNECVHPIVPEKGSVGASGDLAPLSHMTLVLMGEGQAEYKGKVMSGREAMRKAGIQPVKLDFKEGVALNNGTQFMTAIAALTVYDAERLVKAAEVATALSLEALRGISDAFDERIHRVRPHQGQVTSAHNIRWLTAGSKLITSGEKATKRGMHPQDPYCLRCAPQVLGAVRDTIGYVRKVVETEINAATDNPLVFAEDELCLSGGNFHGQPVALAMDILGTALATVGNIAERRIARLIDENLSRGLPAFLIHEKAKKGLRSGFMAVQYTAAALASENKVLAHPASVDSIPTSANFEDFVSMGPTAARKAMEILHNVEYIVATELLCAAQGVDFRGSEKLGKGTKEAYLVIRRRVPPLKKDRPMYKDIEAVKNLIRNGELLTAINA